MILTLSSEGARNTVFTDERGLPVYKSTTPFHLGVRTTTVYRRRPDSSGSDDPIEVVGRIDWHVSGSPTFTIDGTNLESNSLTRHGFFGRKRTFTGPDDRRYRWDIHQKVVVLSVDDASRAEIARYHPATLGIAGSRKCAYLEIAPEAEHMSELIIFTFICVKKVADGSG